MSDCDKYLSKIEERCKAATPGPWSSYDNYVTKKGLKGERGEIIAEFFAGNPMYGDNCNDTEFVADSRTDIETLVKMVRCARGAFRIALWEFNDRTQGNSEAFAKMEIAICNGLAELDRLADSRFHIPDEMAAVANAKHEAECPYRKGSETNDELSLLQKENARLRRRLEDIEMAPRVLHADNLVEKIQKIAQAALEKSK